MGGGGGGGGGGPCNWLLSAWTAVQVICKCVFYDIFVPGKMFICVRFKPEVCELVGTHHFRLNVGGAMYRNIIASPFIHNHSYIVSHTITIQSFDNHSHNIISYNYSII